MEATTKNQRLALIKKYTPGTRIVKNALLAALVGGLICTVGHMLGGVYLYFTNDKTLSSSLVSITLIIVASILTALGVFDRIARHAGAGTLVPITGFSNAVTSQALDSKSEGFVMGVGSKIFNVSGPVILFGIIAGAIYGIIYFILGML